MQSTKQIIHTPAHFFGDSGIVCLHRLAATDNTLVERGNFHVRIADTQDCRHQVSVLINRMYAWRGYQQDESGSIYRPNQTTLQACRGKDTLGTLSLNIDSEDGDGLLADNLYRKEIDVLRKHGGIVCELTALAVNTRAGSNELLATLFHLLHILGHRLHRATDAVIEINPRHAHYYQRILGFRQIGERKICGRVHAPAVLLHIETNFVEMQIAQHAGRLKKTGRSLYPYFFSRLETERLCQRMLEMGYLLPTSRKHVAEGQTP